MGGCVNHGEKPQDLTKSEGKTTERMYLTTLARTSPLKNIEKANEFASLLLSNITKRTGKTIANVTPAYRASQHRFKAAAFHKACSGKKNTIMFAVTTTHHIFGGFTPCPWEQDQYITYHTDERCQSFLFSIHEGEVKSFKLKEASKQFAIMNDQELGPIFGQGHDIHISDEADKKQSWNNLGKSYECEYKFGSVKANSILTSEEKYHLREYEIWDVQFA